MLVFGERGKPEYLEKNLSQQGGEPTTNLVNEVQTKVAGKRQPSSSSTLEHRR